MALSAGRKGVAADQVDSLGKIKGIDIPIATSSKAGLVKPVGKAAGMTQDVGSDSSGKLYTSPGGVTLDVLATKNEYSGDYDLSHPVTDYKVIIICVRYLLGEYNIEKSAVIPADFITAEDYIGLSDDVHYCYFYITSLSKISAQNQNLGTISKVTIYGIK